MYPVIENVKPGSTLFIPFHTFDSNDPSASVTITGLATSDIEVYKDASMTQRGSDSGYALVDTDGIDLDTITGIHGITIDLSDNTTAGFWAAGSDYVVVISSITVDAATINFIAARFTIGYKNSILDTTIATLSSQTSFTLTNGPADDNALNGCPVIVHDVASSVQIAQGYVLDYTGGTKTVTLAADPGIFTMAAGDNISLFLPSNVMAVNGTAQTANDNGADINTLLTRIVGTLAAGTHNAQSGDAYAIVNNGTYGNSALDTDLGTLLTRIAQTLNLTASGNIGIDWANVENPTTVVDLSATDINLVDTCTANTDMRGTDGANTTVPDAAGTAASLHSTTDGLISALNNFDPLNDTVALVTDVSTKTGYSLSTAGIKAIWDQLTTALTTIGSIGKKLTDWVLGSDSKVILSSDTQTGVTIPSVTTVGTCTTNSDMRGTDSAALAATALSIANWTTERAGYLDELAAANLPADIDAVKAKTDNLPSGVAKNVALANFPFMMVDSTDHVTPKTLLTVTATISKDGGAFASCTNTVTEISNGMYKISLTQTEMNADVIVLKFTATGADQRTIVITTS